MNSYGPISHHQWTKNFQQRGEQQMQQQERKAHMDMLRARLNEIPKPKGWTVLSAPSSYSITSPTRRTVIKVLSNNSVFIECKNGIGNWKSRTIPCDSIDEAANTVDQYLNNRH